MKEQNKQSRNWTTWIEIPVLNFEKAQKFYEAIFEIDLFVNDFGDFKMGIFPHKEVGCAICKHESYTPSKDGSIVYLNANPDLQPVQDRIEKNGGKLVMAKKQISEEHGFMCVFIDTEGNRLALHSDK
jgi:predicted enzyme related to lactoylglutathione lyase